MADMQHFEQIYFSTYQRVLKYIVMHCSNIEDVNDIVQEAYIELHNLIKKNRVEFKDDLSSFIIGIAKNKMKDFYRKKKKYKIFSLNNQDDEIDSLDTIPDNINIEDIVIKSDNIEKIWLFIKKKNVIVGQIFYLYYYLGLSIKDIAQELETNDSTIKNHLYRTIKEMRNYLESEVNVNV